MPKSVSCLKGDNPYYINILKSVLTSNDDVDTLTSRFFLNGKVFQVIKSAGVKRLRSRL